MAGQQMNRHGEVKSEREGEGRQCKNAVQLLPLVKGGGTKRKQNKVKQVEQQLIGKPINEKRKRERNVNRTTVISAKR